VPKEYHKSVLFRNVSKSIILMLAVLIASSCRVSEGNGFVDNKPTIPHINVLSVKYHWPIALELAQKWHSDAYLVDVIVDVKLPQADFGSDYVHFGFQSPSNEKLALLVSCSRNCYFEEVSTRIRLPQCLPFEIDEPILEGEEVLELGLILGGVDYVNSRNAWVQLRLERNFPRCDDSTLTWRVTFGNYATYERVTYTIDAVSGELLEVR